MKVDIKHVIGYGVMILAQVVTITLWRADVTELKRDNEDVKQFIQEQVEINAKITYIIDNMVVSVQSK